LEYQPWPDRERNLLAGNSADGAKSPLELNFDVAVSPSDISRRLENRNDLDSERPNGYSGFVGKGGINER
jgi:hypothetical protein